MFGAWRGHSEKPLPLHTHYGASFNSKMAKNGLKLPYFSNVFKILPYFSIGWRYSPNHGVVRLSQVVWDLVGSLRRVIAPPYPLTVPFSCDKRPKMALKRRFSAPHPIFPHCYPRPRSGKGAIISRELILWVETFQTVNMDSGMDTFLPGESTLRNTVIFLVI